MPFKPLGSRWLGRSKPTHLSTTIVQIDTDTGLEGFGETCPIGAIYLPAFPEGVREALGVMAPALIGQDPCEIEAINRTMDTALFGYPAAKAAVDIACWDLLGKSTGLPVHALLGGAHQREIPLYASIFLESPGIMVETLRGWQDQGYRNFQVKVGGDPMEDVERIIQNDAVILQPLWTPKFFAASDKVKGLEKLIPLVENKVAIGGKTTAYVCEQRVCKLPTSDPAVFIKQISETATYAGGPFEALAPPTSR